MFVLLPETITVQRVTFFILRFCRDVRDIYNQGCGCGIFKSETRKQGAKNVTVKFKFKERAQLVSTG